MNAVERERELCAKLAEGRGILHRAEGRVREAKEAYAIAAALRSRSDYPERPAARKRRAAVARI